MGMDIYRDLDGLFEFFHEIVACVRCEQSGHVLDTDGVGSHALKFLCILRKVVVVMYGADGIGDGSLHVGAFLLCRVDGSLKVAGIVECVEDTHDVDSVRNYLLYEVSDHIICVMPVSEHVLPAEQHLHLCMGHLFLDASEPLPRILVQEAQAGVERGTAPHLHGIVPDLIHGGQDGKHLVECHTCGDQRLMSVAEHQLIDLYFSHLHFTP